MSNAELTELLQKYDKHLWGINATYKEAARLMGIAKPSAIKIRLWDRELVEAGDVMIGKKPVYRMNWRGNTDWYKHPDWMSGPKKATAIKNKAGKVIGLSAKQWDRLKVFFAENRDLIESDGSTMEFVIRLCRYNHLPANTHIVSELLALKKVTLKGVV